MISKILLPLILLYVSQILMSNYVFEFFLYQIYFTVYGLINLVLKKIHTCKIGGGGVLIIIMMILKVHVLI